MSDLTPLEESCLARMAELADQIAGKGMRTSISYPDLRCLLQIAQRVKEHDGVAKRPDPVVVPDPVVSLLEEGVLALADVVENHPELWGSSGAQAAKAWAEQHPTMGSSAKWVGAVEKVLGHP